MPREAYQDELDDLREAVFELGVDVRERLEAALSALRDGDDALARSVVAGDEEINDRYLELESTCISLFALQQPVAGDLRFVAASYKVLTDVERVGDLATNLAEYAMAGGDPPAEIDALGIGDVVCDQLDAALDAYEAEDPEACRTVAERDDDVDALCQRASEQVVRDLVEREVGEDDGWSVERVLDDVQRVLLTIRDLERVGDHAVNVAARTLYMVENDPELLY